MSTMSLNEPLSNYLFSIATVNVVFKSAISMNAFHISMQCVLSILLIEYIRTCIHVWEVHIHTHWLSQWAGWHGPTNIVHNLHLDVYLNFIAILENFQKHVETGYFETGDKFELGGSKSAPYPLFRLGCWMALITSVRFDRFPKLTLLWSTSSSMGINPFAKNEKINNLIINESITDRDWFHNAMQPAAL